MKLTTILAASSLLAIMESPSKGADGYKFLHKEFEQTNINIEFVIYPSYRDLQQAAKTRGVKKYNQTRAFSILHSPDYRTCTVHIIDPEKHYDPEFIGHEITHCIYGRWHDRDLDKLKYAAKSKPIPHNNTAD